MKKISASIKDDINTFLPKDAGEILLDTYYMILLKNNLKKAKDDQ